MAGRLFVFAWALIVCFGPHLPLARCADPPESEAAAKDKGAAKKEGAAAKKKKDDAEYYELYKVFADTLDQVERNYVKDVSRRELMEAAIRGVISKLDPYSNYIPPEELTQFETNVESQFGGIGIRITLDNGRLQVLTPIVGSPAYKKGVQSGDVITEIEGKSTDGISMEDAVRRLKGEAGTKVTITVVHPNASKPETMTIEREVVRVDTVLGDVRKEDDSWDFMLDHDKRIGYIRITAFSRDTARDLQRAMKELEREKLKGLIVDLRFNPGGLLTSAIEIADLFVAEGKIVSTSGRNSPERVWEARKPGTFEGFPMAVLVNRYSASASEIVSACLQDHKRAIVVGERTWGKGSVQNVIKLEDGKSALKLTTAGYLRPNGHNIHRFPDAKETDEWGVMPDEGYLLKLSDSELVELTRHRRDSDVLHVKTNSKDEPDPQSEEKKPEEKKSEDKKPDDKTSEEKKPDDKKPADEKSGDKKPAETKPVETKKPAFVDRQLQKALDYLTSELARAN